LRVHNRSGGGRFTHAFLVERSQVRRKQRVTVRIVCIDRIDM
jgi:hypothetical protein